MSAPPAAIADGVRGHAPAASTAPGAIALRARAAFAVMALLSVAAIAIRYAEPILDGDLFWHLKYAEQMIGRGTPIPDHTLYSWTPTNNDTIYCTWIGDLLLYGLYQAGGLGLLAAFRYVCLAICGGLLFGYARARDVRAALPVLAVVVLCLVGSRAGTIIKPEILSLVAFHFMIFAYAMARNADRSGRDAAGWFLAMPAILLVWVNSHGGFIFAAPFFAAIFAGELLARWRAHPSALSRRGLRAMLLAFALCGIAIFLTPYGWRYPAQLVLDIAFQTGPRVGESWNNAYQSVVAGGWSGIAQSGALMAGALTGLLLMTWRRLRQADWGLLIAVVVYTPLYFAFIRTTFYIAVVFGYAALDLLALACKPTSVVPLSSGPGSRRLHALLPYVRGGAAAIILALSSAIAVRDARIAERGSWIGFGISAVNPVVEAEFLAASRLAPHLYNYFDAGGYLLWRLDPTYKVMIDPRFFPYKAWFDELYAFSTGQNFEAFLKKYPANVAVVDLIRAPLWRNFLQSKDWRLAFFGPTSAIFVDSAIADDRLAGNFAPDRFDRLRNGRTALEVFDFALVIGDYTTAWKVLGQAEPLAQRRHVAKRHRRARGLSASGPVRLRCRPARVRGREVSPGTRLARAGDRQDPGGAMGSQTNG